jgi:eukaryotic-like serine/threonine-protein kinase
MNFLRFLKSKIFILNFAIAAILLCGMSWGVLKLLDSFTLHGETITVPDLRGYTIAEAEKITQSKGLRYFVADSVHDIKNTPGAIIDQDPKPEFQVKNNRTIYLTVNAVQPPKVKMPNLVDFSLRQAIAILETSGLKVGNLSYVPDIAFNAVISQEYRGNVLEPGTMVVKGSAIDLILGKGLSDELVVLPSLFNLTIDEAFSVLYSSSLTIGSVIKDETVKDSTQARVYRQAPVWKEDAVINMGTSVDIYVTQSTEKLKSEPTPED